jgi:hypothetical protein
MIAGRTPQRVCDIATTIGEAPTPGALFLLPQSDECGQTVQHAMSFSPQCLVLCRLGIYSIPTC